ncbi:ABC transporter permease [Defluviimonas sp. SAOS-178_SWC]|uniref:ABC transporter permease n=1 Tax=Defluviimonas sp. SAOS-178_SWC TaxID=3121287 RepID=UPI003221C77A
MTSTATPVTGKQRGRRRLERSTVVGLALIAPLSLVIILFLLLPLSRFLSLSANNTEAAGWLSHTSAALAGWSGEELPSDDAYAAIAKDVRGNAELTSKLAARLNFFEGGMISLLRRTSAKIDSIPPTRDGFVAFHKDWGDLETWRSIYLVSQPLLIEHYLNALDLRADNPTRVTSIEQQPERQRIFQGLWLRTILVALVVICACTLIGYPLAFYLSRARGFAFMLGMGMVLLPFWTPLLARITSWQVLLETTGVIPTALAASGLIEGRMPALFNNLFATILVMTYVLLPFAVLPTYAVMNRVSPSLFRAALTLGASPGRAFFQVYLPQTLPGVIAGSILIFVFSFGFYLTPELVGGPGGSLIGNQIAYHFSKSLNWGLAAALSGLLLVIIAAAALLLRSIAQRQS